MEVRIMLAVVGEGDSMNTNEVCGGGGDVLCVDMKAATRMRCVLVFGCGDVTYEGEGKVPSKPQQQSLSNPNSACSILKHGVVLVLYICQA
jgi:hypothetical protein